MLSSDLTPFCSPRSFLSLPQKDDRGSRTDEEQKTFSRAIKVMGCCYASITGTTVLQCKDVPPCPPQYVGLVIVFSVPESLTESGFRELLRSRDYDAEIKWQDFGAGTALVDVKSSTEVERLIRELLERDGIESTPFYNVRPYESEPEKTRMTRKSGRIVTDGGTAGRGWPAFEQGASKTVAAYLATAELKNQLPRRLSLAQSSRPKVLDISGGKTHMIDLKGDPESVLKATFVQIEKSKFTVAAET